MTISVRYLSSFYLHLAASTAAAARDVTSANTDDLSPFNLAVAFRDYTTEVVIRILSAESQNVCRMTLHDFAYKLLTTKTHNTNLLVKSDITCFARLFNTQ